jgi:hypothetical protein
VKENLFEMRNRKKVTPVSNMLDALDKAVLQNPTACFLAEMCVITEEAYSTFLRAIRQWVSGPFAPWDSLYVMAQITKALDLATASVYPRAGIETAVRKSLSDCGFHDEERLLYFDDEPSLVPDVSHRFRPGIHLRLSNDGTRRQFGSTQDFGVLQTTVSQLNISGDGLDAYRILFHECGHSIHFVNIKSKYQTMRLAMPVFYSEAVAQVFEALPLDAQWMKVNSGISAAEITRVRFLRGLQELFALRENLAFALTELLVTDSVGGFEDIWPLMARMYLYPAIAAEQVGAVMDRNHMERFLFYENSALNVVMSTCIGAYIRSHVAGTPGGSIYLETTKERMLEFMRPGGSIEWEEVVRMASGHSFHPEAVGEEFKQKLRQGES